MRKIRKIKPLHIATSVLLLYLLFATSIIGYAAEATLQFGSEAYQKKREETFPVALYLKSEERIGTYSVKVQYDALRMKYVGVDNETVEANGILTFQGEGETNTVQLWLEFEAISGGQASIEILSVSAFDLSEEALVVASLEQVEVEIEGEDTAAILEEEQKRIEEENRIEQERLEQERIEQERLEQERLEQERIKQEQEIADKEIQKQEAEHIQMMNTIILCLLLLILLEVLLIIRFFTRRRSKRKDDDGEDVSKERSILNLEERKTTEDMMDCLEEVEELEIVDLESLEDECMEPAKEVAIQVKDVSMEYKVSTSNASGIKEYFIQKVKKQVSYRKLEALSHVSFEIYQGEVVGIIGTNGSGKSTLLKIISGALNPSSGRVIVDRSKIQLLTLGTGFDIELSARENVYLSGSICGYTREFLDEHYEKIVEFAELEGFMEEKVKNFSSGMVSRLGFAIATVGDAAEILILDEVLSVGDEFFRKKSLKRVKEMIHGGSTVLMVSHGTSTILENCTKAVWIEKGVLKMVGIPTEVCEAYREKRGEKKY